ncbi:glycosyltransferase family 2 protein [Belliella kenyensis]|uniref:Glycosyltransferase family 2 protein n=1 Tax=Belliella kenyensis TaxID=1472724 RepID=A0ABV8EHM3_9BACT|nr:glycosyltransferase family 2 protein [Belliella kenyensis]MCH7402724.1 glycosyltransferase [Belliella kenyensis]MDN3603728.1 glycosyltransferase family 2 protein [Belliella kenyensis]
MRQEYYRKSLFQEKAKLNAIQIEEIEQLERKLKQSFLKIALNFGYLSRRSWRETIQSTGIELYQFEYASLEPIEKNKLVQDNLHQFLDALIFPLRQSEDNLHVVLSDPSDSININRIEVILGQKVDSFEIAEDLDVLKALHVTYGAEYLDKAVFGIYDSDRESCAIETFTKPQLYFLGIIFMIGLSFFFFFPIGTAITINIVLNLLLLISISFKFVLTLYGSKFEVARKINPEELEAIDDKELPFYTILLPVFKESEVIHKLVYNLKNLDYPREKLDIKLLIESDDEMTYNAVKNMNFPCVFEPVIIPYAQPKTKPKACNYGLYFSKGKYLTIYDAEDIPDNNQLKLVHTLFKKISEEYVVVQCALNYFNKKENLLTRLFTLEYSYWFDYMLPGLDNLDVPIPLGGTSNHFRFDKLMELGGWDGFNVTEDADLGLRAYAKSYKVTVLDSTTLEEANNDFFNWIRQRSRWIKGYMQTFLVHMRNPLKLYKKVGLKGFLSFQFFIGGTFFTFLVYPVLLVFLLFILFLYTGLLDKMVFWNDVEISEIILGNVRLFFPDWLVILSVFNFVVGNLMMIYVNMIAVFRRKAYSLMLFSLINPFYWLMHSVSAYKGLIQLITKPFYWEKTNHGLTKATKGPVQ